jgi:hypothetical protein
MGGHVVCFAKPLDNLRGTSRDITWTLSDVVAALEMKIYPRKNSNEEVPPSTIR